MTNRIFAPSRYFVLAIAITVCGILPERAIADTEEVTSAGLRVTQTAEGYAIRDEGKPVLFYQTKPKSLEGKFERAGYVHPLYDLDGNVITEDFPKDHLHHRGIFWAWHQLYVGNTQIGDPWICRNFLSRVDNVAIVKTINKAGTIKATTHWVSPDWTDADRGQKPIVREETEIRVHRQAAGSRAIDFRIRLTPLENNVQIGGSDNAKGYGGFSPRLRLPKDIRFTAEYGNVEPQTTAVAPSRWMDFSATFAEADNGHSKTTSGVTVLCHPSLPGFPQKWILRKARSMQNPVFPGRKPVALSPGEPLELRYRLVIHQGAASREQITEWFESYAAEK